MLPAVFPTTITTMRAITIEYATIVIATIAAAAIIK